MKKSDIIKIVKETINSEYPQFDGFPINEEKINMSSAQIAKKLNIKAGKRHEKLYAFTVINNNKFSNILRLVIDENGKFIKISISK